MESFSVIEGKCFDTLTYGSSSCMKAIVQISVFFLGVRLQPFDTAFHQHVTVSVNHCVIKPPPLVSTIGLSRLLLGVVIIYNIITSACIYFDIDTPNSKVQLFSGGYLQACGTRTKPEMLLAYANMANYSYLATLSGFAKRADIFGVGYRS